MARPIFFATLIIITAYFPLFALQRGEAKLFTPMAYTVGYALFGALLCTLALIPGLAYVAFRKPRRTVHNRAARMADQRLRRRAWRASSTRPKLAIAVIVAMASSPRRARRHGRAGVSAGARRRRALAASQMPTGLSLDTAMRDGERDSACRAGIPGGLLHRHADSVEATRALDAWTPSHIEAPVGLTPYDTWPEGETKEGLRQEAARATAAIAGVLRRDHPADQRHGERLEGGAHSPLVIRIIGDDFTEMRRIAGDIVDELRNITGHGERVDLPGAAASADRDPGRSCRRGPVTASTSPTSPISSRPASAAAPSPRSTSATASTT